MEPKLPDYVVKANVPLNLLMRIHCRSVMCGNTRRATYARLSHPNWQRKGLTLGSIKAACLRCGEEAVDYYNWHEVKIRY